MSVPLTKRKTSETEYYHTALKIRKEFTLLLFRDFGIKPTKKEIKFQINYTNKFQLVLFRLYIKFFYLLFNKNIILPKINIKYPIWFINQEQCLINQKTSALMDVVELIYRHRSNHQIVKYNQIIAIDICYSILSELQLILIVCKLNIEKYKQYIDLIYKEINLLEGLF